MKAALAGVVVIAGVGVMVAFASVTGVQMARDRAPKLPEPAKPVWIEAKWPFPMDEWGVGKAFVCAASDCGTRITLTVRPKIGYCNCATGVADEAELERVSDNALVARTPQARGRGHPVKIGWMTGLSRAYEATDASNTRASNTRIGLVSVAYNDECDVVVALATFGQADASRVQVAVVEFLASRPMVLWAKTELGLEFVRREW